MNRSVALLAVAGLVATTPASPGPSQSPGAGASPLASPSTLVYRDPNASVQARVRDLLGRMTLAEKVGQITLIERGNLPDPQDVATFGLGAVLSGGGSSPPDNTPA